MRAGWIMAVAAMLAHPMPATGQGAPIPVATDGPIAPATSHQRITIAGRAIAYRATWFETALTDPAGRPQATNSATAYVRDGTHVSDRPVMIFFNGGPGASSSPLHINGFGPRRQTPADAGGRRHLVDNPATLLDVADLLFVDPVGTGFSRQVVADGGKPYWSPQGDADAMLRLIRDWLAREGRSRSPLVLVGESYGGYRIGMMAKGLRDLPVAGLVLISPALDFLPPGDQNAIDALPTMAAAAVAQGRRPGTDVAAVWEEARRFAQTDYAVALQQGSTLPPAERRRIADRLAALTGLTAAAITDMDLRIDTQRFLETLVPGRIVGRLDTRIAAPRPDPATGAGRPAAANDPALGLGRSNVILSPTLGTYLRDTIGVKTARDYQSLTLDVNFAWDWRPLDPGPGADWRVTPRLAALMQARPAMRLLVLGGYYDLATPLLGVQHALAHAALPSDRTTSVALPAGHTPFEGADNLRQVSALLHRFVQHR